MSRFPVGVAGVVGLPLLLALVVGAAWADEPFLFFLSEWYRSIRVAAPHFYDASKAETRQDIDWLVGRLKARARSALARHITARSTATPDALTPDLSPNTLTV